VNAQAAPTAGGQRQLKVGLVLPAGVEDAFGRPAFVGLERAVKELGIKGRVLTPSPREGFLPSFSSLTRQAYDLVIGVGAFQARAIDAAAVKFPQTKFAIIDARRAELEHKPKNISGLVFEEQEVGYLAGYLAARMAQLSKGRAVVSSVGGARVASVERYIAGYQAGARRASPDVTVLNRYANDFLDPAKCRAVALDQIAKGSGVVFQVAGACGLGALEAASEQDVWGIGVDADQSFLGPHILTSAVKRMDVAVFTTIRDLREGAFRTGVDSLFSLANGGVALGKISPKVSKEILAELDEIRGQIAAGRIRGIPTQPS